jgi:hypothetical protein
MELAFEASRGDGLASLRSRSCLAAMTVDALSTFPLDVAALDA